MDELKNQSGNKFIALSLGESFMFLVVLVLIVSGLALGAGFYLGVQTTQTAEVASLCNDLMRANEDRVTAIKVNYGILEDKVKKYEEFLVGTGLEPTLPVVTRPSPPVAQQDESRYYPEDRKRRVKFRGRGGGP